MYGWLMMAEKRFDKAQSYGAKARQLSADNIESAILEGLATAYEKPARAREALQILRRGQLNASPDDWHYERHWPSCTTWLAIISLPKRNRRRHRRSPPLSSAPNWNANKWTSKLATCHKSIGPRGSSYSWRGDHSQQSRLRFRRSGLGGAGGFL